jgi:hypothetical protein
VTAALAICIVALGFGLTWLAFHIRAGRIVERRSRDLEQATGIPAGEIRRELREHGLTPGQWAIAHGLDPITFRRR